MRAALAPSDLVSVPSPEAPKSAPDAASHPLLSSAGSVTQPFIKGAPLVFPSAPSPESPSGQPVVSLSGAPIRSLPASTRTLISSAVVSSSRLTLSEHASTSAPLPSSSDTFINSVATVISSRPVLPRHDSSSASLFSGSFTSLVTALSSQPALSEHFSSLASLPASSAVISSIAASQPTTGKSEHADAPPPDTSRSEASGAVSSPASPKPVTSISAVSAAQAPTSVPATSSLAPSVSSVSKPTETSHKLQEPLPSDTPQSVPSDTPAPAAPVTTAPTPSDTPIPSDPPVPSTPAAGDSPASSPRTRVPSDTPVPSQPPAEPSAMPASPDGSDGGKGKASNTPEPAPTEASASASHSDAPTSLVNDQDATTPPPTSDASSTPPKDTTKPSSTAPSQAPPASHAPSQATTSAAPHTSAPTQQASSPPPAASHSGSSAPAPLSPVSLAASSNSGDSGAKVASPSAAAGSPAASTSEHASESPSLTQVSNAAAPAAATSGSASASSASSHGAQQQNAQTPTATSTITDQPETTLSKPIIITTTDAHGHSTLSIPPLITSLSTSKEPDGSFATVTHVIANPTGTWSISDNTSASRHGFFANTGAVAGVFLVVGIVVTAFIAAVSWIMCKRRRRRRIRSSISRPVPYPDNPFEDPRDPPSPTQMRYASDSSHRNLVGTGMGVREGATPTAPAQAYTLYETPGNPSTNRPSMQLQTLNTLAGIGAGTRALDRAYDPYRHESHMTHRSRPSYGSVGIAITSDEYVDRDRDLPPPPPQTAKQAKHASLTPSTPSIYPATLPEDRDDKDGGESVHLDAAPEIKAPTPVPALPPISPSAPALARSPSSGPPVPPRSPLRSVSGDTLRAKLLVRTQLPPQDPNDALGLGMGGVKPYEPLTPPSTATTSSISHSPANSTISADPFGDYNAQHAAPQENYFVRRKLNGLEVRPSPSVEWKPNMI